METSTLTTDELLSPYEEPLSGTTTILKHEEGAESESEFGKGCVYCIGLFLSHAERCAVMNMESRAASSAFMKEETPLLFFNGASDHLYDLDVSTLKDTQLADEIQEWKTKCIGWGHGFGKPKPTNEDVVWSISKAKEFLFRIDKTELGIVPVKARWD